MKLIKPLGYYTDDSSLRFHVLDVGEGLMILIIFPNDQVMLFDCNITGDNESTILKYLSDRSIKQVDLMRKYNISRNTLKKYVYKIQNHNII